MSPPNFDATDKCPLSKEILAEPNPDKFQLPPIRDYDGTTDPESHVKLFNTWKLIMNYSDAVACRVFPTRSGFGLVFQLSPIFHN